MVSGLSNDWSGNLPTGRTSGSVDRVIEWLKGNIFSPVIYATIEYIRNTSSNTYAASAKIVVTRDYTTCYILSQHLNSLDHFGSDYISIIETVYIICRLHVVYDVRKINFLILYFL